MTFIFIYFNFNFRSKLVHAGGEVNSSYDQQRGGTHAIGGAGETDLEKEKRILFEREQKLKKKLQSIKKHRDHVRHERHKRHVPIIAVVGYTNAGKDPQYCSVLMQLHSEYSLHA